MALDEWNVSFSMTEFCCIVKRILKLSAFAYAGFGDLVNSRATDSAILALNIMMTGQINLFIIP